MSSLSSPMTDSAIMVRRNVKHNLRTPMAVFQGVLFPIVIMLMFVYVLGGAFDVGVDYVDYATPGLLVMALGYGLASTSTAVHADVTKGVMNRFRVMDVSRGAVLTGHVLVTTLRGLVADLAIIAVAFLLGFSPGADALDWLGAVGLLLLLSFGVSWITVAVGLAAKSAETAAMSTVPLIMLPFLSTAFVPADTMGPGVRQFAEYQPFTPIIETLRGLLAGTPSTGSAIAAILWCLAMALVGYVWAISRFNKQA